MLKKGKEFILDVLYDMAGGLIMAVGLSCFVGPAQIAPGGVSGLAILVNFLTGLPVGTVNLAFNIPLLLLAWRFLGRVFTLKTLRSVFIQSVMIDLASLWLPAYTGDRIMAALFGGIASGVGLALVFMRGSTTGGTDIVSRLIQLRYRHLSMGKLLFLVDVVVLLLSVVVFRNIEAGLYGMLSVYTAGKVLDNVLYGLDTGKVLLVISERNGEIAQGIMEAMNRGVTFLHGAGAWSGEKKQVLLCAVRAQQCYQVEEIIRGVDPDAFMIVMEANEIAGEGFRPITEDKVG
ncbi:MAG: YitT family protein [Angelakisella sp.]|jgi:uncharacterized membrane-anchored protein YitT (DUF2179 family)|nr:YitT family protein [Angelakisella sp.]